MKKAGREARKIPCARRLWNPTLFAKCAKRMGHPAGVGNCFLAGKEFGKPIGVPPPPSPFVESWSYMLSRLQTIDSPGLIWKIFRNKDLQDPFASLRISA